MKICLIYTILLSFLLSTTELGQLLKIPVFFQHLEQHEALNHNLTIWQFLYLHYGTDKDHDADDHKLPFKSSCSNIQQVNLALPQIKPSNLIPQVETIEETPKIFNHNDKGSKSGYLSSVWQPPKNI